MSDAAGAASLASVLARVIPDPVTRDRAPIVIVARRRNAVVWMNGAARALFRDADETRIGQLLFEGGPVSQAFAASLRSMRPGGEPRLERLRLGHDWFAVAHVVLCRVADDAGTDPLAVLQWIAPIPAMPLATASPVKADADRPAMPTPPGSAMDDRHAATLRRSLWTADREGFVTAIEPAFARLAGPSALAVGDHVPSRLLAMAPESAEAVERILRDGGSLAATRIAWPRTAGDPIPVEIGCTRRRGAAGGLSGFCVVHALSADALTEAPDVRPVETVAPDTTAVAHTDADPVAGDGEDGDGLTAAAPQPDPAVGLTDPAPAEPAKPRRDPPDFAAANASLGSNIVHFPAMRIASVPANFGLELRSRPAVSAEPPPPEPSLPEPPAGDLEVPRWSEDPVDAREAGALSADEREAFEQIGQVLGTRPPPARPAAETPEAGPTRTEIALAALVPFLDAIPTGLLWQIDGVTGANRAFRERSGLLAGEPADALLPDDATGPTVQLVGSNGASFEARVQAGELFGSPVRWFAVTEEPRRSERAAVSVAKVNDTADFASGTAALDIAADGYALLEDDGTLTRISPGGARLFGYEPADLVGRLVSDLAMPDSRDEWRAVVSSEGGDAPGHALVGRTRTGQPVFLAARVGRIAANGLFIAWTDDADRQRLVSGLEAARKEAERTSALKSEFLTRVSHEIRTPLNAILGFAEVIRDERLGPVGNGRYLDYLRDIHASGTHVMSLVNDLLDLSRIEAGRMDLRLEAVEANEIVNACVNALQQQATRDRIIVRLSLTPGLPAALADERSLRQIVLNLLSNAIKFNEPGGQVIVSTAAVEPDSIAIRIRDTGIGMTDSEIEIAMEPFRQVSAVKRTGSGLGLPVTKALVEANCASMTIRSTPGQGTLVEVTFPMVEQNTMSLPAE